MPYALFMTTIDWHIYRNLRINFLKLNAFYSNFVSLQKDIEKTVHETHRYDLL